MRRQPRLVGPYTRSSHESRVLDSRQKGKHTMRSRRAPIPLPLAAIRLFAAMSLLGAISAGAVCGQDLAVITPRAKPAEAAPPLPRANIRIDTNVVLIPVTVTDPLNRFVTGLEQDSFKVFEDKLEQKIVSFGSEDAPLSIGIVFDTSGSMGAETG